MSSNNIFLAFIVMLFWGVGSFVGKIATNKIGDHAVFWDLLGYAPGIILYSILIYNTRSLMADNKVGIIIAVLAGLIGSFGLIGFYVLLSKKEASTVVPLTALYPIVTTLLAVLFLKEKLTLVKGIGIILSGIAIFLLSL